MAQKEKEDQIKQWVFNQLLPLCISGTYPSQDQVEQMSKFYIDAFNRGEWDVPNNEEIQ